MPVAAGDRAAPASSCPTRSCPARRSVARRAAAAPRSAGTRSRWYRPTIRRHGRGARHLRSSRDSPSSCSSSGSARRRSSRCSRCTSRKGGVARDDGRRDGVVLRRQRRLPVRRGARDGPLRATARARRRARSSTPWRASGSSCRSRRSPTGRCGSSRAARRARSRSRPWRPSPSSCPPPSGARASSRIYAAQLGGAAFGPLLGAFVGVRRDGVRLHLRGGRRDRRGAPGAAQRPRPARAEGRDAPPAAHRRRAAPRRGRGRRARSASSIGAYESCWTLLMHFKGASSFQLGLSWTLFALPYVVCFRLGGWFADHADRRVLAVVGIVNSCAFCAIYPLLGPSTRCSDSAASRPSARRSRCPPRSRS